MVLGQYPQWRPRWLQAAMVGNLLLVASGCNMFVVRVLHGVRPSW